VAEHAPHLGEPAPHHPRQLVQCPSPFRGQDALDDPPLGGKAADGVVCREAVAEPVECPKEVDAVFEQRAVQRVRCRQAGDPEFE
jgi:hypothetical protein